MVAFLKGHFPLVIKKLFFVHDTVRLGPRIDKNRIPSNGNDLSLNLIPDLKILAHLYMVRV